MTTAPDKHPGRFKLARYLESSSLAINRWVEYLLFGFGFSMALIVAAQVFFRYGLNESLFWSEELARYLMVWLTFLGASVAYRRKVHPSIDVVYTRLPQALRQYFTMVVYAISLFLFAVMIVYGIRFAYFVRLQITPALYLPKWIVFSIIPISGIILSLHALAFIFNFEGEHSGDR